MLTFLVLYPVSIVAQMVPDQLQIADGNRTLLQEDLVHGYVAGPNYRGTLDILWSCCFTIFACVYSSIHLNVTKTNTSSWRRLLEKVRWALMAMLFPESMLIGAWYEYKEAQRLIRALKSARGNKAEGPLYAADLEANPDANLTSMFTMSYGFFAVMGGFVTTIEAPNGKQVQTTLTSYGIEKLAESGHFVEATESQRADHSKADTLAKLLVCIQVIWLFLHCIVRVARDLPLTLLELHTMVHVVCALCIYALWWHKPLDVQVPISVDTASCKDLIQIFINQSKTETYDLWGHDKVCCTDSIRSQLDLKWTYSKNDYVRTFSALVSKYPFLLLLISIYGAVHLSAWNFGFPTHLERFLWQIAGCITTISSLSIGIAATGDKLNEYHEENMVKLASTKHRVMDYVVSIAMSGVTIAFCSFSLILVFSRAYLVVESFISLRTTPIGVFEATPWVQNIPHM